MKRTLDTFTKAYIEALLWSSTDDGEPLNSKYSVSDISNDSLDKIIDECNAFQAKADNLFDDLDMGQCGHDFALTRNHHGTGFWDRQYQTNETEKQCRLTDLAHDAGESWPYVGDDGKIYV